MENIYKIENKKFSKNKIINYIVIFIFIILIFIFGNLIINFFSSTFEILKNTAPII